MMLHKLKFYCGRQFKGGARHRNLTSFLLIFSLAGCSATTLLPHSECSLVPAPITAERITSLSVRPLDPAPVKLEVPFSNVEIDRLNLAFTQTLSLTGATAASVTIARSGGGTWSSSIGLPSEGSKSFWWASVGKMVTATIILQLVEEGQLALGQTIDRWFPNYPGANSITLDHLLTHTSGVFSYDRDRQFRQETGYHSPEQLIAVAASHGPDFCSGTQWDYSNTGYLMLGIIAEKIEGASIVDIVERRIARPLGLNSLRMIDRDVNPQTVVPFKDQAQANAHIEKISAVAGAGGIVAEPVDMIRFLQGWISGQLLTKQSRDHALSDLFPMFGDEIGYGRGIIVVPVLGAQYPTTWLGHNGGSPNSKGVLIFDLKRQAYVALALNTGGAGEALANTLLKALDGP